MRFWAGTRWLHRLPMPLSRDDELDGYWWELSMRQVEVSRTVMFDAPRRARGFFEALIADNLDIGHPASIGIIFGRRIRRDTPGTFRTVIDRPAIGPDTGGVVLSIFYKRSRIKQYLNCDMKSHAVSEYVDWRFGSMLKT